MIIGNKSKILTYCVIIKLQRLQFQEIYAMHILVNRGTVVFDRRAHDPVISVYWFAVNDALL